MGEFVWNRLRYVKDPETGKRVSRLNPASALIVREVPAMRIVPPDLWQAVKARPLLHPEMGKLYREWVIDARNGLRDADRRTDAMTALRAMVEEIVLTPEQGTLGIVLKSDLAAMLAQWWVAA